jgi:hypothetical protein
MEHNYTKNKPDLKNFFQLFTIPDPRVQAEASVGAGIGSPEHMQG